MSEKTVSQVTVDRNKLKKLTITISMTAKNGYSSKTTLGKDPAKNLEPYEILRSAIKELAFISHFNMPAFVALQAFNDGLEAAFNAEHDFDI